jgi:hypothetical protein
MQQALIMLHSVCEKDIAALLSCLVFNQKTEKEPNLTPSQKELFIKF